MAASNSTLSIMEGLNAYLDYAESNGYDSVAKREGLAGCVVMLGPVICHMEGITKPKDRKKILNTTHRLASCIDDGPGIQSDAAIGEAARFTMSATAPSPHSSDDEESPVDSVPKSIIGTVIGELSDSGESSSSDSEINPKAYRRMKIKELEGQLEILDKAIAEKEPAYKEEMEARVLGKTPDDETELTVVKPYLSLVNDRARVARKLFDFKGGIPDEPQFDTEGEPLRTFSESDRILEEEWGNDYDFTREGEISNKAGANQTRVTAFTPQEAATSGSS
jgi:hypothetical protein